MDYAKIIEAIKSLANNKQPDLSEDESLKFSEILFNHNCYFFLSKIKSDNKFTMLTQATLMMNKATIKERYSNCQNVFNILNITGVNYAVIKGTVLSQRAYGDYYYRKSSDIDLLIERNDIEKIKDILLSEDFIQGRINGNMIIPFTRQELLYHTAFTHQTAPFIKKTNSKSCPFVNVDINTNIMWGESSLKANMTGFLNDVSSSIYLNNYFIKRLPIVKEFIALCLHHYKDLNSIFLINNGSLKLSLFCDIYFYFINNFKSIDTTEFMILIDKLDIRKYIYYCIYYTNLIFSDECLSGLLHILETPNCRKILNRFGLEDTEYKEWNIDFLDRLFNDNFHQLYESLLTEKDFTKINSNSMM
jgi:hypothetical protein